MQSVEFDPRFRRFAILGRPTLKPPRRLALYIKAVSFQVTDHRLQFHEPDGMTAQARAELIDLFDLPTHSFAKLSEHALLRGRLPDAEYRR